MLKSIPEFSKSVLITGFKDMLDPERFVHILDEQRTKDIELQALNADHVATWQHLYFAVLNSLAAFKDGSNISRSISVETLLYASAQHQIQKAMRLLGINDQTRNVALVIIGNNKSSVSAALSKMRSRVSLDSDDRVLELTPSKKGKIQSLFGISETELATARRNRNEEQGLTDLIIERMALLNLRS